MSKVVVRYKHGQRLYLMSPHKFGRDEFWSWDRQKAKAHVFESRKAAKDLIRTLTPQSTPVKMSDLTFEKPEELGTERVEDVGGFGRF